MVPDTFAYLNHFFNTGADPVQEREPAMGNLKERLESGELELPTELEALHAQVDDLKAAGRQARDDATAALDLVSRIRMALNDNGKRMQDELLIYCRELAELPPRVAELEHFAQQVYDEAQEQHLVAQAALLLHPLQP